MIRSVALALVVVTGPAWADTISGTAHIIDGDTIDVAGHRVRIHGIDAPEGKQTCHDAKGDPWEAGKEATEALRSIIGQQTVTCTEEDRPDRYKRMIASCRAAKIDIGAEMVRLGWARAFVRYSNRYTGQESAAQRAKRGIWAGVCEAPWEWRSSGH